MARGPGKAWVLPLAVLPLVACKPKAKSDSPDRDVRSWTIAEIEAELVYNDQVLANEGIMVAVAPTVVPPQPAGPAGPSEDAPQLSGEEPSPGEDDGGAAAEAQPPEPEPGPTAAMPEPATQPEMVMSESPGDDARSERRASRRLSARRDGETRCERVCGLAEATCELETQICELAARHPDEPRYAQACLRAEQQCKAASEACQRCEG